MIFLATVLSLMTACEGAFKKDSDKAPSDQTGDQGSGTSDNTLPKTEENPAIRITELMVVNTVGAEDKNGKTSPWIEFYNQSDAEVDLSEYSIRIGQSTDLPLPAIKIPSGAYAIVFVNGESSESSIALTLASKDNITITHGGAVSQSLIYTNKSANHSFIVENGSESSLPTPGYANVREKDDLIISELMSTNSLFPIDGVDCDWIELRNDSDYEIDLSKYYAGTDSTQPYRARLPEVTLGSGEYIVLACGRDLPFNLSKDGESVYFTRNDGVLAASVSYEAMEKNTSWTFDNGIVNIPSPGYENTELGYTLAVTSRKGLLISEVVSSNTKYSPFNKKYCDMVEIFNGTDEAIDLSKYFLSDKGSDPFLYRLPEITLGSGEYYVIYCDADVSGAAPIGISSDGENIWLTREDGYISDALAVPAIPVNRGWGRYENRLVYFATPTISKANTDGYETITKTPLASSPSGIYTESLDITLSGDGIIYYTTDGSAPTTSSAKYNGEVIKVDKNTSIRAIAYGGDKIPSYSVTYNYFINMPEYTLPVMKISMLDDDLFGSSGIYTNYNGKGERLANCAFYIDGNEEFSIDCGIKVFGAYSRRFPKKSFQLEFRKQYGKGRLEYRIFENLNIDSFSNIVLRSGSQNSYYTDSMIVDEYVTSLAAQSGNMTEVLVQSYRPCHLYLNGEYWGIYFIREKIDDDFVADHFGVSKGSVTVIDWTNSLKAGSSKQGWNDIWYNIYTRKRNFSNDENYKWLADQLDLESFADMIIMRMWTGDMDLANIRAFKSPEYDDGKWHFILYDNDISFRGTAAICSRFNVFLNDGRYKQTHALFRALMENSQFREYFLARLAFHLNNTICPEKAHAHLDSMIAELENDMPYQIARWKNNNSSDMVHMGSMDRWRKNLSTLRSWTDEVRVQWFVQDAARAMKLSRDDVAKYMGEEFAKYID